MSISEAASAPRILETCVYPICSVGGSGLVMLAAARSGHNQGKWVPIGSVVPKSGSPHATAAGDLEARGLSALRLEPRGLVTEIGSTGWQTVLFLYAGRMAEQTALPQPDQFASEYRWFTADSVATLLRPQADARFSPRVYSLNPSFFEMDAYFDDGGVLQSCDVHYDWEPGAA